jgi:hypothetical protein
VVVEYEIGLATVHRNAGVSLMSDCYKCRVLPMTFGFVRTESGLDDSLSENTLKSEGIRGKDMLRRGPTLWPRINARRQDILLGFGRLDT